MCIEEAMVSLVSSRSQLKTAIESSLTHLDLKNDLVGFKKL
jgi:hypothetical protein